jgi:predicted acyl esterase
MVQMQSTWFPLYDVNPQTYVENILKAKPRIIKRPHTVFSDLQARRCISCSRSAMSQSTNRDLHRV